MRIFASSLICFLARAQITPQAAPLVPDPQILLKEIQANQHKMDDVRENYTFHRIRTEEDLDEKGAVIETTTQEREVFFVNGRQIARLVKKDGVELCGSQERNEQTRVRKLIETATKSGSPPRRKGLISQILPMAKISNPRRLSLNGRPTLAYDFIGDPSAKGKDMNEKAAKKMAGTIWFDEADRQIARFEVHFYENFRIGGFLANIQKGTRIALEQSPIGDGLWMQTSNEQHVVARIAVKGYRENVHMRDFDFKKFNVDVLQKVSPPARQIDP